MNRTLVIVKPDGVERGLVGEILSRLEKRQLRLVAVDLRTLDAATAKLHYAEHDGKPFFDRLVAFITSGPSFIAIVEGPEDTWRVVRTMIGATNPGDAAPGTIRADLAVEMSENVIHGSDSSEAAQREIAIFFPDLA